MPRPKTKTELLLLSKANYEKLLNFINTFSKEEQDQAFPEGTMNRNIRDVLGHLYHWQLMFMKWYEIGMTGVKPEMPAKGYTWKMNSELNHWILEKYNETPLETITQNLNNSHQAIIEIINQHTNDELFEKKRYKWTGSTSVGAYIVSATSSHYDWAFKLIKKAKK